VEISEEDNPSNVMCVSVCADVHAPCLFLQQGTATFCRTTFRVHPSQDVTITLVNSSGFFAPFSWECPVGENCHLCSIEIEPKNSIVRNSIRAKYFFVHRKVLKKIQLYCV